MVPDKYRVRITVSSQSYHSEWWEAALLAAHLAPASFRQYVAGAVERGNRFLELSAADAEELFVWASALPGWEIYGCWSLSTALRFEVPMLDESDRQWLEEAARANGDDSLLADLGLLDVVGEPRAQLRVLTVANSILGEV